MYRQRFDRVLRPMVGAMGAAALAAVVAIVVAGCGASGSGGASSPLGVIDQATRTVQLNLFVTRSEVNGYSSGAMTVRVPQGWKVDVYCSNRARTPLSCAIVSGAGSRSPVFSGAASPNPTDGVPAARSESFSFIAGTVGSYRMTSLVPAGPHGAAWEHFDVVATGRPSVSTFRLPANQFMAHERPTRRNG